MPAAPKNLSLKISKEHIRSIFQTYGLEKKLLQELGLGLDILM